MQEKRRDDIRNIAIIAHVDHGKTTLVDELLKQSGLFRSNQSVSERMMDSDNQEKERGITILSKIASVQYGDCKINIVDTPGHADFSGEVERILKMVDGVCLLVDAFEGAMPQTRFVTRKALELGLKPLVVINKIDREDADPQRVLDQVYDLFIELDASEEQLDFPVVYASAKQGLSSLDYQNMKSDMNDLFDSIVQQVPGPISYPDEPLQVLVTNLDYSDYVGRLGVGRIHSGSIQKGQSVLCLMDEGKSTKHKITNLYVHTGLGRAESETASAGEIVVWSGVENMNIGDTIADIEKPLALERIKIDEPTLIMNFIVNDSPFAGQDGKFVTTRNLKDRLFKEAQTNVALRVEETDRTDTFKVVGRGELHLSVLIENMRREGFEFQVSKPSVVLKKINGQKCEPYEELVIDLPEEYSGMVIELLGKRKAEMFDMIPNGKQTRLKFYIPARGLIGFRSKLMTLTRGYGSMASSFLEYRPYVGDLPERQNGVLLAKENTVTNMYALFNLQDRGVMFLDHGVNVYKGQVVGLHNRDNDLTVSIGKTKKLTNMRASGSDDNLVLSPPRKMSLEQSLEFINQDELVEITPSFIRLRKRYLEEHERKRYEKTLLLSANS